MQALRQIVQGFKWFDSKTYIRMLLIGLVIVVSLTILQDFFQSVRNNNPFIFSESLLFKTLWILFLPILVILKQYQGNKPIEGMLPISLAIMVPTLIHLVTLPLIIWLLSMTFFDHHYGYYKVLTYTLSYDLYKLLLVYGLFVLWHKHRYSQFSEKFKPVSEEPSTSVPLNIVVSHGRKHTTIKLNEIVYISAATPYVTIHLEHKQYLHAATIKSMLEQLDDRQFIRVHRSSIVNVNQVISYKSRLNGDYDLILQNGVEVRLSRNYLDNFKDHLNDISKN